MTAGAVGDRGELTARDRRAQQVHALVVEVLGVE